MKDYSKLDYYFLVGCLEWWTKSTKEEIQQELYKWIRAVGIEADNCPDEKSKHFLLEVNEILEKQSDKICNETQAYLWRKK